ncbi:MAG: hypothetical protein M3O62_00990 [Pseudomonadota bacterium]|nr:hypothetical protein [Pseudomonadota bacterium]
MQRQNPKRRHASLASLAVVVGTLYAGVAMAAALVSAPAVAPGSIPPEQTYGAINYRMGGIGAAEAQAMREISPSYPLTLTFAERAADGRGMFTAGVAVQIVDASGTLRLDTVAQGPMMLVNLPSGEYTVKAALNGEDKAHALSLRAGEPSKLVFVWPAQDGAG